MSVSPIAIAAVDLGASSGRVSLGVTTGEGFALREVHRFPNVPVWDSGVRRWDIVSLFSGVRDGLRAAARDVGRLDSVGVDSWGVDYGLLDVDGQLLSNPAHYRDARTERAVARTLDEIGARELYTATGIQLQPFNTLFQLLADRDAAPADAAAALLIPDLISYWLTGVRGTELTNASTTALLDPRTMDWSRSLAERLAVPIGLFPPLRRPGDDAGSLLSEVASTMSLDGSTRVIAVPSHDTAAAVAGIPAEGDDFAFVCTGTWALVGLELPSPIITEESRQANFTNEVGVDATIRFLRNVAGFWLLQECVREWNRLGDVVDVPRLTAAAAVVAPGALVDVQDPAFAAPDDMPRRIVAAARRTSGAVLDTPADITRCILNSMALAIRHAIRDASRLAQRTVRIVHVVGGGVSSTLFCQLVADACQLPVVAGPVEAASWGNVMAQARALGAVGNSRDEARQVIRGAESLRHYTPSDPESTWERGDELVLASRGARA